MNHARESVRTFESAERKSVMIRNSFRVLVLGLALSIVALFALSSPANAAPKPVANTQPTIVTTAYVTGNVPTEDCITTASLILGGVAIRAGAAAWTVGNGAITANAASLIDRFTSIIPAYHCLNWLVPQYVNLICQQSRGALFNYHTLEARALVVFATLGRKTIC